MKKRFYTGAGRLWGAAVLAAALFTAGCGAASGSGAAANGLFMEETDAAAAYDYGEEVTEDSVSMAMAPRMAESGTDALSGEGLSAGASDSVRQSRKLIRRASLHLETQDFDGFLASVQERVTALGGYVESSDVSGSSLYSQDNSRDADLCARIPSDRLDEFLSGVSEAANVINRSESLDDVTLQYTDVESHKKTLEVEQERLWELMEKAEDVDAIIALEQRLSEIRYQLESYESQLRTYDNQVNYSTVDLHISEVKILTSTGPDGFGTRIARGFRKNLAEAGAFLADLAVGLITGIPVLLVLALFAVPVLAAVYFVRRRLHRKRTGASAAENLPDEPGKASGEPRP